ncbi:hypothetical protein DICVIV_11062 [Dictyocaulus viviparus]|uniref:Uncharacterized protein n=1 Tax=Dictyocaulus viviparus TaxID=29172 RepID=A0A0D8XGR1_DICVI|nr:hypothetical protein DICVIV_11062 [Dictyocaulus viviparus]
MKIQLSYGVLQKTVLTTTKLTESDLKSENNASENTVMSGGNGRKGSSGLLPSLNRIRIQHCFKAARPTIGEAILKRASNNRCEMRILMSRLTDQQIELMGKQFYMLIAYSVENIERVEMIQQHARTLGETYAALCRLGFRPDYFTSLADAAIAECVKLDGGTHKSTYFFNRCETLLAWSQLIGTIFTSVRDGYYSRVRYQRRFVFKIYLFFFSN